MRGSGLRGRRSFLLLAATTAALWTAGPAGAYDAAPNRGFELLCGGFPCYWLGDSGGTTFATSDTTAHTGARSLFVVTDGATFAHAESACITGVASGSYNSSVWYRQAEGLTQIRLIASFYPSTDCSGTATQHQTAVSSPPNDALWRQLSGFGWEAPPGTYSARVALEFDCPSPNGCDTGYSARFDDISLTLRNLAPNPSFESWCGFPPCSWRETQGVAVREPPHTGNFSLGLQPYYADVGGQVDTVCLAVASGAFSDAFWYSFDAGIGAVGAFWQFVYTSSDCSGTGATALEFAGSAAPGWQRAGPTEIDIPPTYKSEVLRLEYVCDPSTCFDEPGSVDDVMVAPVDRAPNRSFEDDCGGILCYWSRVAPGETFGPTTTQAHTGARSLLLGANGVPGPIAAASDCITVVGSGSHDGSAWYRSTSALAEVSEEFDFYTSANCTGSATTSTAATSPGSDGGWHQIQATLDAPPGTESAQVILRYTCNGACTSQTVYFDDASLDGAAANSPPTSVLLTRLDAARTRHGVELSWSSGGEAHVIGYAIERGYHGLFRTITKRLVMAAGAARGASYRLVDYGARSNRTYAYRLFAVDLGGHRTFVRAITAPPS
jgi:hypothetical protein